MYLHSPINSNQLQHWICFYLKQGIFFLELNKKNNNIASDFIRGTEYPKI